MPPLGVSVVDARASPSSSSDQEATKEFPMKNRSRRAASHPCHIIAHRRARRSPLPASIRRKLARRHSTWSRSAGCNDCPHAVEEMGTNGPRADHDAHAVGSIRRIWRCRRLPGTPGKGPWVVDRRGGQHRVVRARGGVSLHRQSHSPMPRPGPRPSGRSAISRERSAPAATWDAEGRSCRRCRSRRTRTSRDEADLEGELHTTWARLPAVKNRVPEPLAAGDAGGQQLKRGPQDTFSRMPAMNVPSLSLNQSQPWRRAGP
jgi:hypothetical protein